MIKLKNEGTENLDAKRASSERVFTYENKKSSPYFQDNLRNCLEDLRVNVNTLKR